MGSGVFNLITAIFLTAGAAYSWGARRRARRLAPSLPEAERMFKAAFEQAAVGMAHVLPDGRFLRVNHRLAQIVGYSLEELQKATFRDLTHPDDLARDLVAYQQLLRGEIDRYSVEKRYLHRDGHTVWIALDVARVQDESGQTEYFATVIQDISERRRIQASLDQQQSLLVQSARFSALGEMAGGIAHEINNPLAILVGRINELKDSLGNPPSAESVTAQMRALDRMESTVMRISRVMQALSRFALGGEEDPPQCARIKTVVTESLDLCAERIRSRGIELRVGTLRDSILIRCQSGPLQQVILNLLSNACDAVDGLPEKWIAIEVLERSGEVEIQVSDSGKGILPEVRARIGQPFFSTKPTGKGIGLGLSISRRIVESHRGTLALDPACRHTTWVIRLPKLPTESWVTTA